MAESTDFPAVAIVVLNWNGGRDTLACLQSLLLLDYPAFRIIVCDNGSTDGSIDAIEQWAAQRLQPSGPDCQGLRCIRTDRTAIESGAFDAVAFQAADLVLIANGANLGFAAGNNVGIRAALEHSDAQFVWVLNNDTVVDRAALTELIVRMGSVQGCGMCGSALVSHHDPDTLQAVAGVYNRWFARTSQLASGAGAARSFDDDEVTRAADFAVGASMLLSRALLEDIGMLSEDYFLYFEEIDLVTRARARFGFACATRSRVTHKWGASINPLESGRSSAVADYYFARSRLLFTRRYHPNALPTVLLAVVGTVLGRLVRGRWRSAQWVLEGLVDGLLGKRGARIVDGRPWPS